MENGHLWPLLWWLVVALATIVASAILAQIVQRAVIYQPFVPSREHSCTPAKYGIDFDNVRIRAADGVSLHGWLLKQPIVSTRAPTVIFCHGNAGNVSGTLPFAQVLYKLGMNVLLFDYRGFGESSGAPTEAGLKLDLVAAFEFCASCPDAIDGSKLVLYGRSLGGAVATWGTWALTVGRRPPGARVLAPPCCLILENTFTSLYGEQYYPAPCPWCCPSQLRVLGCRRYGSPAGTSTVGSAGLCGG